PARRCPTSPWPPSYTGTPVALKARASSLSASNNAFHLVGGLAFAHPPAGECARFGALEASGRGGVRYSHGGARLQLVAGRPQRHSCVRGNARACPDAA